MVPIPGTTKLERAAENAAACPVELKEEEVAQLEALGAMVSGARANSGYTSKGIEAQEASL